MQKKLAASAASPCCKIQLIASSVTPAMPVAAFMSSVPAVAMVAKLMIVELMRPVSAIEIVAVIEPASSIKIMLVELMPPELPESPIMEPRVAEEEPIAIVEAMDIPNAAEVIRPVVRRAHVVKVVPGARADKHAVRKPLRSVIAIRRAAKGIRRIEPPFTDRRRVIDPITRADVHSNANRNL
jgi:hypothetical protein